MHRAFIFAFICAAALVAAIGSTAGRVPNVMKVHPQVSGYGFFRTVVFRLGLWHVRILAGGKGDACSQTKNLIFEVYVHFHFVCLGKRVVASLRRGCHYAFVSFLHHGFVQITDCLFYNMP